VDRPVIVVALGGNALAPPGRWVTIHDQFRHTRQSLDVVVDLVKASWRVVIVHGNGPQVGNALLRNELAAHLVEPLPLGILVASTAGWIGYMIQQSLANALRRSGLTEDVITVITQTEVSAEPDGMRPTKPIGGALTREDVARLRERGISVATDASGRTRRLAPSPAPVDVVEWETVKRLLDAGSIVVAGGGGGTPVRRVGRARGQDRFEGVEAVVDKDLTAALLGARVGADTLLILTNVPAVYRDWGTDRALPIPRMSVDEVDRLLASGTLGTGSMRPKMEAAQRFIRAGGRRVIVSDLAQGMAALQGDAGTTITESEH
jgi:carbamate kinase